MAISVPALIATIFNAVSATNPQPITLAANVASGDCIVVLTGTSVADATQFANSVTDSAPGGGNTYVNLGHGGTTFGISAFVCYASKAPLVSGVDTVSVGWNVVGSVQNIIICSHQGTLSAAASDAYGLTSSGSAGTSVSRATGALAQAAEIVYAYEGHANAGGAPSWASVTLLGTAHTGATSYLSAGYSIRASTATFTPTATILSANWSIATFGLKDALADRSWQRRRRASLPGQQHPSLAAYR